MSITTGAGVSIVGNVKRSERARPYHLIPPAGLRRIADRYRLGAEAYGVDNWKTCLDSREHAREFARDAYSHMQEHVLRMLDGGHSGGVRDDDLAAVGWAVTVLAFLEEHFGMHWRDI